MPRVRPTQRMEKNISGLDCLLLRGVEYLSAVPARLVAFHRLLYTPAETLLLCPNVCVHDVRLVVSGRVDRWTSKRAVFGTQDMLTGNTQHHARLRWRNCRHTQQTTAASSLAPRTVLYREIGLHGGHRVAGSLFPDFVLISFSISPALMPQNTNLSVLAVRVALNLQLPGADDRG